MHPEITEFASLPNFTHWLIIPECDRHYAFAKAVTLLPNTDIARIESEHPGVKVCGFIRWDVRPNDLPTAPVYKK